MIAQKITQELERIPRVSVVAFVDAIFEDAIFYHASDIHIHPERDFISIKFRIDGVLEDVCTYYRTIFSEVVSRIKILASLRTDEHTLPQDGRFRVVINDSNFDVRVSIVPTHHGESIVFRLLTSTRNDTSLGDLGFSHSDEKKILDLIKKKSGMVLVTGPTGSGKTTTLYTLIKLLNSPEASIVTIEDPIEYAIAGIKQIQTHTRLGFTFAHGLRSVLRQDPDIIMVGEIRDGETAHIAVHTALTGHLLLSTLHTIDAATAIPRCIDMGIEPFLIASTLRVVVAQRLVRRLCQVCKQERDVSTIEREMYKTLSWNYMRTVWMGVGCSACKETGFLGRIVVSEVLVIDDEIRECIIRRNSAAHIRAYALAHGMTSMISNGFKKIEEGVTSPEEVMKSVCE